MDKIHDSGSYEYMKILTVSDQVDPRVYSRALGERYGDVELVISCGDLPYDYLDFIMTGTNRPLYYVHGNHDPQERTQTNDPRLFPMGATNLHRKIIREHGLLLAGVEGSILYNQKTPYQYSQRRMWSHVFALVPGLMINKLRFGRYLDIFVTHAPMKGVHEGSDWTHQGIQAFRWLVRSFQPAYHLHGHIHYYHPADTVETRVGTTMVVNTYRSRLIEF